MQFHDLAAAFPLMDPAAFDELCSDIERNGLNVPIQLYDGKILDGRNRYNACIRVGVEPKYETYTGLDPLGFSYLLNAVRRHLTPDQKKIAIAYKLKTAPEKSNTTIAKEVKISHKEVAKVRKTLEEAGTIPDTKTTRAVAGAAAGVKGAAAGVKGAAAGVKGAAAGVLGGRPRKNAEAENQARLKSAARLKELNPKPKPKEPPDEDGYWFGRKYLNDEPLVLKITKRGQAFVPDRAADRHMMEQWSNWFHDTDKRIHMRPPKKEVESLVQAMNWVGIHYGTPWDIVECACKYLRGYYHESKDTADPYKFATAVKCYDLMREIHDKLPNFFPAPSR